MLKSWIITGVVVAVIAIIIAIISIVLTVGKTTIHADDKLAEDFDGDVDVQDDVQDDFQDDVRYKALEDDVGIINPISDQVQKCSNMNEFRTATRPVGVLLDPNYIFFEDNLMFKFDFYKWNSVATKQLLMNLTTMTYNLTHSENTKFLFIKPYNKNISSEVFADAVDSEDKTNFLKDMLNNKVYGFIYYLFNEEDVTTEANKGILLTCSSDFLEEMVTTEDYGITVQIRM
jgi:hypothetical protein